MKSLLAAEGLKLRTTPAAPAILAVISVLAVALPIIYGTAAGTGDVAPLTPSSLVDMVRAPAALAGGAVLLVGLLSTAGEFRHRTIFTSRLQEPRDSRLLFAKLVSMVVFGLATGVLMQALSLTAGALTLKQHSVSVRLLDDNLPRTLMVLPLALALQGLLGVAIGALLRNTAAAVGATLVWAFIVEGVLPVVLRRPHLIDWLPSGALKQVSATHSGAGQLGSLAAAGLLLGYAALLLVAAIVADRRREL